MLNNICIRDIKTHSWTKVCWQTNTRVTIASKLSTSCVVSCLITPVAAFSHGWSAQHRMMLLRNDTTTLTGLSWGEWHHHPHPLLTSSPSLTIWGLLKGIHTASSTVRLAAGAAWSAPACTVTLQLSPVTDSDGNRTVPTVEADIYEQKCGNAFKGKCRK